MYVNKNPILAAVSVSLLNKNDNNNNNNNIFKLVNL